MEEDRDDDRDRDAIRSMRIQRSSVVHVSQGELLIISLTCVLNARAWLMIAWTRVHAISAVPTESNVLRASTSPAKGKTVWDMHL